MLDLPNLLSSRVRQKVFRLYFSRINSRYYLRELERLLHEPVGNIKYRTLTRRFDQMRRRRNLFTYDPMDNLTEKETMEALKTAKRFVQEIIQWIKEKDPQLELF